MAIKYIFFDLDGTLLPMEQERFVSDYAGRLAGMMGRLGFDPKDVVDGLWAGVGAMVQNRSDQRNDAVFWQAMRKVVGDRVMDHLEEIDRFYLTDFQEVRHVCGFTPAAKETVDTLKAMGYTLVLATNPLFPRVATESRVRWAGLEPEDFAHITVFDNSYRCKPTTEYYEEVLRAVGARPEEVLMVGNDAKEDMAAQALGMQVFLLTDCLINSENRDISGYPQGGFGELMEYVKTI